MTHATTTGVTCPGCGNPFRPTSRQKTALAAGRPAHCTRACQKRASQITKPCEGCGVTVTRRPSEFVPGARVVCSPTCRGAVRKNTVVIPCGTCGTPTERVPSAVRGPVYCTRACYHDAERQERGVCAFAECAREGWGADGLCEGHQRQKRDGKPLTPLRVYMPRGTPCPGPDCGLPILTGGYCGGHAYQVRTGKPLTPIIRDTVPRGTPCWVGGEDWRCGRSSLTRDGICRTHYRYRATGDDDWQRPIPVKAPDGAGHTDKEGYRIVQYRGKRWREHRAMADAILREQRGYGLTEFEDVHHADTVRHHNEADGHFRLDVDGRMRSGNFVLWAAGRQPRGGDVGPQLEYARALIRDYGHLDGGTS